MIVVRRPGLLTSVQDLGRPGYAHLGVPRAGAVDVSSLRLANRLVGNDEASAALEITPAGVEADGEPVAMNAARYLAAGSVLSIGRVTSGVRAYLGVRGGIDVAPTLGSRSMDTLSRLGPAPLAAGTELRIGRPGAGQP